MIGYILAAAWEESIDTDAAAVVLTSVRKILSHCKDFVTYRTPTSKRQQFLNELMALKKVNEENTSQKKSKLGFPEYDKYFVLSFKIDSDKKTIFLRDTLQAILKEEILEYNHYLFAIVGCRLRSRISEQTYPKLIPFLKENDMYAGLSNGFLDFSFLKTAFEQSIVIPSLRQYLSGEKIRFCSVNTLREQFGIDFEDPREFMKIRLSCTAYGFIGTVKDSADLFGPMI
ncbi:MAG: hypothetical protein HFG41_06345 [Coprococcus sp.]|nr:hypothetical protein [Coprococcus sp.]